MRWKQKTCQDNLKQSSLTVCRSQGVGFTSVKDWWTAVISEEATGGANFQNKIILSIDLVVNGHGWYRTPWRKCTICAVRGYRRRQITNSPSCRLSEWTLMLSPSQHQPNLLHKFTKMLNLHVIPEEPFRHVDTINYKRQSGANDWNQ